MKVVLQRVSQASVSVDGQVVGSIKSGYVLLVGFGADDTQEIVKDMAEKIVHLRAMSYGEDKMNKSVLDVKGSILVISQFTLYADTSKGRRPYFGGAASPEIAKTLYELFIQELCAFGVNVENGEFGAMMQVSLINDGPVTILL